MVYQKYVAENCQKEPKVTSFQLGYLVIFLKKELQIQTYNTLNLFQIGLVVCGNFHRTARLFFTQVFYWPLSTMRS